MEDKRKRTANFNNDEKAVLTQLVLKYQKNIENKRTDATTNAEKLRGWSKLAEEFNNISTHCFRNPNSLKTCWENIKRQSKKDSASRKREVFKTGGGRPPSPPSHNGADSIVGAILGPALEGLSNKYDSDALDGNDMEESQAIVMDNNTGNVDVEFIEEIQEASASTSFPQIDSGDSNTNKKDNLVWQGWTPKTLKMPVADVLKPESGWLKRRRPQNENLSDQHVKEKIRLVQTLIKNAEEESKLKRQILEEQLKEIKIKNQKLEDHE